MIQHIILILTCFLFSIILNSQQVVNRVSNKVNGSSLEFGYHRVDYLNQLYVSNVENQKLSQKFGLNVGYQHVKFPLRFSINYKYTNFESKTSLLIGKEERSFSENFISTSINFYLIHFSHTVLPSIGIGYNYGSIGTVATESEAKEAGDYVARNYSQPFISFRTDFNLTSNFGLNLFYERSVLDPVDRSMYGICINLFPLNS